VTEWRMAWGDRMENGLTSDSVITFQVLFLKEYEVGNFIYCVMDYVIRDT